MSGTTTPAGMPPEAPVSTALALEGPGPSAPFPVVGIGASAGGLAAFEAFFSAMPADVDPGMAFILVQHLAPDHKSLLAELIRRYTRMQVFEVEDGMAVQPNCAYIIPPNHDMAFLNGRLKLLEPTAPRGQRLPIDFFFRSLAQDQHERSIGIVLSGTGSDGTLGVRAIKGAAGMVMAQTPESTEFDGMPRSAIATGLVDFTLAPGEMPARLITYVAHAFGRLPRMASQVAPLSAGALNKVFVLLRAQTGHDFSQYKPTTIHRRIERRMAVHQITALDAYVKYLQQTPVEVQALFRDLLIGVTNFFRDPEAFAALEQSVIPRLFDDKPSSGVVRIWVTGCSTGEEAYSIAILLQEHMEARKTSWAVQIFATDIDARAIATARVGLYPASIASDLTPERLARFFTVEPGGQSYRIHKNIRDMLVFSEQDVNKDPPFSRLDLISCRNLLIYLDVDLQKKLIPLFHYALKPGGRLFLGSSEGIGEFGDLFAVLDRKAKLYLRKPDFAGAQRALQVRALVPMAPLAPAGAALSRHPAKPASAERLPLRELTEQALLRQVAPAGALVNAGGDILYLHGRTGLFLEPAPGEAGVNNILKMAREGLRPGLVGALRKAVATAEPVRLAGLHVKTNGPVARVNLSVHPVRAALATPPEAADASDTAAKGLYLVVLEEAPAADAEGAPGAETGLADDTPGTRENQARIQALMEELRAKDEYLQSTHEELESSNEELKSSNEEMQSVNEELQSTNEELETSKEELQSVNEELATVNTELHNKVADLSRANNDMNNLLAGTGIATVFVDHQRRILRFTPTAAEIINLIPGDVGRPVGHLVANLVGYTGLVDDVQSVLDTLVTREVELQTNGGKWYAMRIQPYRTLDNVIEGAVLTFMDISEMKRIQASLAAANRQLRLAVVVRDASDAVTVQDLEGRITAWNPGAARLYGWSEDEALQMNVRERIPPNLQDEAGARVHQLSQAQVLEPYRTRRLTRAGTVLEVSMTATALRDEAGLVYAIATTERPVGPVP